MSALRAGGVSGVSGSSPARAGAAAPRLGRAPGLSGPRGLSPSIPAFPTQTPEIESARDGALPEAQAVEAALARFLAAPPEAMRVVEPAAALALADAAGDMAASADPVERYAAAVIESHLEARRELARRLNGLLKA